MSALVFLAGADEVVWCHRAEDAQFHTPLPVGGQVLDFLVQFVGLVLLHEEGDRFAGWLDTLNDEFLDEIVSMPVVMGTQKSRFEMLLGPKEHEMHHRAQLMVVERMLGITPHLTRNMEARLAAMQAAKS